MSDTSWAYIRSQDKRIIALTAQLDEARELIAEMNKFLDYNPATTICNSSGFHTLMKQFVKANPPTK